MIFWASVLTGVCLLYFQGVCRLARALVLLILCLLVCSQVLYYALDGISGNGLNDAVIYHMLTGLKGVGLAGQGWYVITWSLVLLGGLLLVWLLVRRAPTRFRLSSHQVVMLVMLGLALYTSPLIAQLRGHYPLIEMILTRSLSDLGERQSLGELESRFSVPDLKAVGSPQKNIVWIFMEGLETAYFDDGRFGELLPRLSALSSSVLKVETVREAPFTGWTMGGLVGAQCGVPLVSVGDKGLNDLTGFRQFMPGAVCASDFLSEAGYHTEFIGGASLTFAGKGDFLLSHNYDAAWGREELEGVIEEGIGKNVWGYHDDAMFDFARQRFEQLYRENTPFLMSLLTLDTHPPTGFVSPACEDKDILQGDDPMLDALRCSDYLITEFVRFVRQADTNNNTLVVLMTDHYSHRNTVYDKLTSGNRGLVFWIVDPEKKLAGTRLAVEASTYDIAPTVIAMAGADIDGFGFGKNLFLRSSGSGLSMEEITRNLADLTSYLWQPGTLDQDIFIDRKRGIVQIGTQQYEYPVLLQFGDDFNLQSVRWSSHEEPLIKGFVRRNSLMLADCAWKGSYGGDSLCAYFIDSSGSTGVEEVEDYKLSGDHIQSVFEGRERVENWEKEGYAYVFASGGHGSFSGILVNDELLPFARGVNVYALSERMVKKLAHYDTCSDTFDDSVKKELETLLQTDDRVILAVKDSAHCGSNNPALMAESIQSLALQELAFRQPYIAELEGDNTLIWELAGKRESSIGYRTRVSP